MISYRKYFLELKNRSLLLVFTWIFLLMTSYYYKEIILFLLIAPTSYFTSLNNESHFIFTNVSEIFYVHLNVMFFIANQITLLVLFYHTSMFLALGLYSFELDRLKLTFQVFLISWVISLILLYKFILPFSWSFFLSFQENDKNISVISFFFEAKIAEYLEFFTSLYYICLINCQLLAALTLLLTNISEDQEKTKTFRKLFYFIFLLFSTLTTPPDIISQIFLSTLLILTYETFIFLKCLKISMVTN